MSGWMVPFVWRTFFSFVRRLVAHRNISVCGMGFYIGFLDFECQFLLYLWLLFLRLEAHQSNIYPYFKTFQCRNWPLVPGQQTWSFLICGFCWHSRQPLLDSRSAVLSLTCPRRFIYAPDSLPETAPIFVWSPFVSQWFWSIFTFKFNQHWASQLLARYVG